MKQRNLNSIKWIKHVWLKAYYSKSWHSVQCILHMLYLESSVSWHWSRQTHWKIVKSLFLKLSEKNCPRGDDNRILPKNLSWGSPIGITRLAEWWQMVIVRDRFFYPILTRIMDSFSCSPLNTSFYIWKTWKKLPENPQKAEMRHGHAILTLQWRHGSTCGQRKAEVWLFIFIFPMWDRMR